MGHAQPKIHFKRAKRDAACAGCGETRAPHLKTCRYASSDVETPAPVPAQTVSTPRRLDSMVDFDDSSIMGMPTSVKPTTGARSELMACAELMRRGFHVYRCESPAAPFDLVAYAAGVCYRVEVKTLSISANPNYAPVFTNPVNDEWDILALVALERVFLASSSSTLFEIKNRLRAHYGYSAVETVPMRGVR